MDNHEINNGCRRSPVLATSGAGGVAILGAATPFVVSFFPPEKAKVAGAAVEIDVSKIEPGQVTTAEWQGKPTQVVNHTAQQLKNFKVLDGTVSDPGSEVEQQPENCKNETRLIKPNIFVAISTYIHLGCSPIYRPGVTPADLGSVWKGGFFCPCHGSKFDMVGRAYKGVSAPTNLVVLPCKCLSDTTVLVGET